MEGCKNHRVGIKDYYKITFCVGLFLSFFVVGGILLLVYVESRWDIWLGVILVAAISLACLGTYEILYYNGECFWVKRTVFFIRRSDESYGIKGRDKIRISKVNVFNTSMDYGKSIRSMYSVYLWRNGSEILQLSRFQLSDLGDNKRGRDKTYKFAKRMSLLTGLPIAYKGRLAQEFSDRR